MKFLTTNMQSSKGNPVPNQFIIHADDGVYFQSYRSTIAHKALDGTVTLGNDWDYSRTTDKYRSQFLGENTAETRRKLDAGIYKFNPEL